MAPSDQYSQDLFAKDDPFVKGAEKTRVKVLMPLPLAGTYDYGVPEGMDVSPGDFVKVPLGPRKVIGVIWGYADESDVAASKLKDVDSVLRIGRLPEANRKFVDWMAAYCLAAPGAVLRMAMSVPAVFEPQKPKYLLTAKEGEISIKMTAARQRVLDVVREFPPMSSADIAREAGVSASVVKGLMTADALDAVMIPVGGLWPEPHPDSKGFKLSEAQKNAADHICKEVKKHKFAVSLLDGVTGSGKTEVYFEAIAETLRQNKQVLILLPEIALSAQWLSRFEARFGVRPGEWHSDVGGSKKRDCWQAIAAGRLKVVVGARSALHLPFADLGLIIVDEEHEASFKQEDGVIYHARDMAIVRGQITNCPVVLASATPSMETTINVSQGRFDHLILPERHGQAVLPEVTLIDLLKDKPGRQQWISPPLADAVKETLDKGEQVLLFLNRRGYAPLTLCNTCGHRLQCPNCTAWLVEHRFSNRLECHHCGYQAPMPTECPECNDQHSFRACGPGVERLAEEVSNLLPDARVEVVTSDTLYGPVAASAFVDRVTSHETNVIIGTQIVAKGYHFPDLTLVGVIDADLGLSGGDLRASERCFQLLHQVAGRAGRSDRPGRVMIQTSNVKEPVMAALANGDRDGFMAAEAEQREAAEMPPYGRLAALIISGPDPDMVNAVSKRLAQSAPFGDGIIVLGPTPAPLAVLRGKHRRRMLLKVGKNISVQKLLKPWLNAQKIPSSVRVQVDIDPYSFF
ncbi:primosomal protein N' [Curvivirga sp.]|uniref:primosomal protein N' n=1 Tax=Curvivirga sp. TaxID=2856848 RepID=UPI003B5C6D6C